MDKACERMRLGGWIVGLLVLLMISLIVYARQPQPVSIESTPADLQVTFVTDNNRFVTYVGCMTVRWQIAGAATATLNGTDVTKDAGREVCADRAELEVMTANQRYTYVIEPRALVVDIIVWWLVVIMLGLVVVGLWLMLRFPTAILIGLLLFGLALLPRLSSQSQPVTFDEGAHWVGRSERFLAGLQAGRWEETLQSDHPGVTAMYLSSVGLLLVDAVSDPLVLDYTQVRPLVVLPAALVHALAVAAGYWLMRRLFNPTIALLASIFIAFSPFLVAHSQILHQDALVTSLSWLSLLGALIAFRLDNMRYEDMRQSERTGPPRWSWLVVSGILAGLAMLARISSIYLLPIIGMFALLLYWRPGQLMRSLPLVPLFVWGGAMTITWFALYPAVYTSPGDVIWFSLRGVNQGINVHSDGNFFMGAPVADPGLFFYFVAVPLRLTPWALIGVFIGVYFTLRQRHQRLDQAVFLVAIYALIIMLFFTVMSKKFDRYALPAFPALQLVAAYGWYSLLQRLPVFQRMQAAAARLAIWVGSVVFLLLHVTWYQPYAISYFNPMTGGGPVAEHVLLMGWGEGLDQALVQLRDYPLACEDEILTWWPELSGYYIECSTVRNAVSDPISARTTHVVLYVNQLQRQSTPELFAALAATEPVAVISIFGIDYVHIYDVRELDLQPRMEAR